MFFAAARAHLHRGGRDAGHRHALRHHGGEVADDEHLAMARDAQIRLDLDAAGTILSGVQIATERARRVPRRPEDRVRVDALAPPR